jgi:hypothetical protein
MRSERKMSSQLVKTPTPHRLVLVGMIALVAAGAIAAYGLISRARSKQDLVQWTSEQAVPTVALAKLARGASEQSLILPGEIQPYYKAATIRASTGT